MDQEAIIDHLALLSFVVLDNLTDGGSAIDGCSFSDDSTGRTDLRLGDLCPIILRANRGGDADLSHEIRNSVALLTVQCNESESPSTNFCQPAPRISGLQGCVLAVLGDLRP